MLDDLAEGVDCAFVDFPLLGRGGETDVDGCREEWHGEAAKAILISKVHVKLRGGKLHAQWEDVGTSTVAEILHYGCLLGHIAVELACRPL